MAREFNLEAFQKKVVRELRYLTEERPVPPDASIPLPYLHLSRMLRLQTLTDEQREQLKQLYAKIYKSSGDKYEELENDVMTWWKILGEDVEQQEEMEEQRRIKREQDQLLRNLLNLEPEREDWKSARKQLREQKVVTEEATFELEDVYTKAIERKTNEYLSDPGIRARLCKSLQGFSGTILDLSREVTALLAGVGAIPLLPSLFAYITLYISRVGVNKLCDEWK